MTHSNHVLLLSLRYYEQLTCKIRYVHSTRLIEALDLGNQSVPINPEIVNLFTYQDLEEYE